MSNEKDFRESTLPDNFLYDVVIKSLFLAFNC
jgi:hypothetical protein